MLGGVAQAFTTHNSGCPSRFFARGRGYPQDAGPARVALGCDALNPAFSPGANDQRENLIACQNPADPFFLHPASQNLIRLCPCASSSPRNRTGAELGFSATFREVTHRVKEANTPRSHSYACGPWYFFRPNAEEPGEPTAPGRHRRIPHNRRYRYVPG